MSQYFASMFRRRPNDGWFRAGRYDLTTVDIMTALAVFSMFVWRLANGFWSNFFFSTPGVKSGEVWRLVTWPVIEQPDFFVIISLVFFWSFGQQLEALFGKSKFVIWVLAVAIIPGVVTTAFSVLSPQLDTGEAGLGAIFLAGIWVYAGTYPNVRWFEVVPLWAIAAVFTALQVLQASAGGLIFLLATIGAALSVGRSLGLATAWPIPHIPLGSGGGGARRTKPTKPTKPKRQKRGGAGPRVVEGPWSKGSATRPPPPPPKPAGPSPADQAELDGLLDKMNSDGGLSIDDKKRLNELSKRLRDA